MMLKEDKFYTMEDILLGVKVLKLPYQQGVSMLIVLPNKGIDYTVIDDEITAEKFLSWVKLLHKTYGPTSTKNCMSFLSIMLEIFQFRIILLSYPNCFFF